MKKLIKQIKPKNDRANDISMFSNYSHFRFCNGGIILSSDKGIGLPKVFITLVDIAFIIY